MVRLSFLYPLLFVFIVFGPAVPADATTVIRFEFDSLCVRAETIAHVRCVSSRSFRDEKGGVSTRIRLDVLAPVKGNPSREIILTLPGGSVDGQRLSVPGMPRFTPGQETVVFLSGVGPSGSAWPIGLRQGCYPVQTEGDGERNVILQAGVTPLPKGYLPKPTSHRISSVPIRTFFEQIRRVLDAQPDGQ